MYVCMVIEHLFVCVSIVQVFGMVLFLPDVFATSFCECPPEVSVSCVLVADSAVACFHACPSPSLPPQLLKSQSRFVRYDMVTEIVSALSCSSTRC